VAESLHRWPARAMVGDYLRAGAGFAVTFPPLLFVEWTVSVVTILGGLSLLFAWLALRTLARQRALVRVSDSTIARNGRELSWPAMTTVRLRRYGARHKDGGYMEMEVAGKATRIRLDSEISDFLPLARRVFNEARQGGVEMDTRTLANFEALDIRERA
jgi:hypothetical protein